MKHLSSFKCGIVLCGLILSAGSAFSQGTAFTYQGRLATNGNPVTGLYDFTNALYNASSGGVQAGSTITLTAVPVTNGLFTVLLDFGGVFNGTPYWLQIGVRSNGVGSYVALSPRQQLTPTPYAITAENVDGSVPASQLTGTLPAGLLSGGYGNAVTLNNAGNSFSGNGSGLANVNALTLGGLGPNAFWKVLGNTGTTAGPNFIGTTDNQALEVHVNGVRGFRVEPDPTFSTPNVIGGSSANFVIAGSVGNFIGAGGQAGVASNYITGGNLNVIAGGWDNHITNGLLSSIGGGEFQTIGQSYGTIGGGFQNSVLGQYGTVPGGANNLASGDYSFAAGQHAQALHNGAFVWADDSSSTPFASTAANQFVVRAGFMGLNRATRITGAEYFGIRAPVTNQFGGMYVETAGPGLPFYGYAQNGGVYAYTYVDGSDLNKWKLVEGAGLLTVTTSGAVGINTSSPATPLDLLGGNNWNLAVSEGDFRIGNPTYRLKMGVATSGGGAGDSRIYASGGTSRLILGSDTNDVLTVAGTNVGIGTVTPSSSLHVVGDTRITGVTRAGSETGTAEAPDKGIITRRVRSTTTGIGSVVARTDNLTLERDGSTSGLRIVSVASPGNNTIAFTGLTSAGATVNFVTSLANPGTAGTNTVFTDAQNVVSLRGSFGDSYFPNEMTEVSLTRYPGDYYWTGTLTSTFNQ